MEPYTVGTRPRVRKAMRHLDDATRKSLIAAMRGLAQDPRPPGVKLLKGHRPYMRVRCGDYRVIYKVDDIAREVIVAAVGHRRDVYRTLDAL